MGNDFKPKPTAAETELLSFQLEESIRTDAPNWQESWGSLIHHAGSSPSGFMLTAVTGPKHVLLRQYIGDEQLLWPLSAAQKKRLWDAYQDWKLWQAQQSLQQVS